MADSGAQGGMNNYKGVMLCSRPNEPVKAPIEKPYCSRVQPYDRLGLNPIKKENDLQIQRRPNFILTLAIFENQEMNIALQRHKDWLEIFKLKMNLQREEEDEQRTREAEKFERVKEIGANDRVRTKKLREEFDRANGIIKPDTLTKSQQEQGSQKQPKVARLTEKNIQKFEEQQEQQQNLEIAETQVNYAQQDNQIDLQNDNPSTLSKPSKVAFQADTLKDKDSKKHKDVKPKWAYSEKEVEAKEEEECDNLLDFVNNLDYDQYINDLEVQSMVKAIRHRVEDIQQTEERLANSVIEELKKQKKAEKKANRAGANNNGNDKDENGDAISQAASMLSDAQSVHSERSQQSIQNLKEKAAEVKRGKGEWDSSSQAEKAKASIEERIVKHVADEVLRNYKNLSAVHSNQSIRKLLEREAQKYMNKGQVEAPLISVVKEQTLRRNEIDPNNLPYLHRNPAV